MLKAHFGPQISVAEDTVRWNTEAEAPNYEGRLRQQQTTAARLFPELGRDFRDVGSGHWGTEDAEGLAREAERVYGAQIAAVAAGRKPLFHDTFGDLASALAEAIKPRLPRGVHVQAEDNHLFVWNSRLVKPFLEAGRSEWREVRRHWDDGLWLGYGTHWTPGTHARQVHVAIRPAGTAKAVPGFWAPADRWRLFGAARAEDWAQATGQAYEYARRD